jgi:hypothetical protein
MFPSEFCSDIEFISIHAEVDKLQYSQWPMYLHL